MEDQLAFLLSHPFYLLGQLIAYGLIAYVIYRIVKGEKKKKEEKG